MNHPVLFGPAAPAEHSGFTLSADELYISLSDLRNQPRLDHRPAGDFDVAQVLAKLPSPWNQPPAVICFWDSDGKSSPVNLAPLTCPKVLVLGDTHQGLSSLSRAVAAARQEPWDLIVHLYNKQHVHWFDEAGVGSGRTVFIPGLGLRPIRLEVPLRRTRGVVLCGQLSHLHVYRRCMFSSLQKRGIDIELHTGSPETCARVYNEAVVSLNISLNGDFNMRNFEIAAAGGFCLADQTGVDASARPGAVFENLADAERIIRHLLANPDESLAAGRRDQEAFWRDHSPQKQVEALEAALAAPKGPRFTPSPLFHNRLQLYEEMQELTRRGRIHWDDFKELPRWTPEAYPGPNEFPF